MKYVYKDFTGMYYAGAHAGWCNLGGSAWSHFIADAKRLSLKEAERLKEYITGEVIQLEE